MAAGCLLSRVISDLNAKRRTNDYFRAQEDFDFHLDNSSQLKIQYFLHGAGYYIRIIDQSWSNKAGVTPCIKAA